MSYSYRIQIKLPPGYTLGLPKNVDSIMNIKNFNPIKVRFPENVSNILEPAFISFISDNFISPTEAEVEGEKVLNCIIRSFVKMQHGIDFGYDGPLSAFTDYGLQVFQQQFGVERLLPGKLGLSVYESFPTPQFITMNADISVSSPFENFVNAFTEVSTNNKIHNQKELLAIKLYNSSFFEVIAETRYLLLIMAIEVLIDCKPRNDEAIIFVDNLLEMVKTNSNLILNDKESMIGSLKWLKLQSIGQAGRELAQKLGDKKYYNKAPSEFFTFCYSKRSQLVHGSSKTPDLSELGTLSAELQKFISDLILL